MENKFCANCGCVIDGEDYIEHEGDIYCPDCFNEIFGECDYCGCIENRDDLVEVMTSLWRRRSEWICSDCADRHTVECPHCGRLFYTDSDLVTEVDNGDLVCDDCRDDRYWWCEECDTYHPYGEECPNAENRIKNYHEHHYEGPTFYGDGKMYIGVELEVDKNHFDRDDQRAFLDAIENAAGYRLYFEHDGSLHNGFEIISEPHTPKEFIEKIDWNAIFEAGKNYGYSSHDIGTCGLHVHINRDFFGNDEVSQTRGIAKMLYFYENWYRDVVRFARRTSSQASQWADNYGLCEIEECIKLAKEEYRYSRYYCVNLTNSNTVEIRIMRGTLNYDTFMATIDFVTRIARNAARLSYKDIRNLSKWLEGMKPGTLEYMHKRECFGQ